MPPPIMPSVVPPGACAPIIPPCIMAPMPTRPMTASAVHSTASELNTQSAVRSPLSMVVSLQRQCTRDRGCHTNARGAASCTPLRYGQIPFHPPWLACVPHHDQQMEQTTVLVP